VISRDVNAEKRLSVFLSREQNVGNKFIENVAELKSMGTTPTQQNCML
jgi:hypothetical protein